MLTLAFALECQHDERARRAAADGRVRTAQELHNAVALTLDAIVRQADAAIQLVDAEPAEAKRSLADISALSQSCRAELGQLLGVLLDRSETGA
jgi:signal transduction histidine kinase